MAFNPSSLVMAASSVLKVSNLKQQIDGKILFQNLNFELKEKETLVVLGPNGAGKTVLLRTLLGLLPCFAGSIEWKAGVKLGYVPQRVPLKKDLPITIEDFFELKKVSPAKAAEALKKVGLDDSFLNRQLGLLSSGQFQRVLIAWALVDQPNVLLFDEPLAGIDVGGEETIYTLLKRSQRERPLATILVTHDLNAVYSLATNVLCINGKIACHGRPRQVLKPDLLQELYGGEIKYFRHQHD